ncbi:hypothetical protein CXF86_14020 [Shewanella sp. GutCb]|uniref:hypothetical protein n=1 Tax=Shewanella sp. GutCb TaxID=2058315 RepID=UPI000C7DAB74|nr:hypothetical protein [Shewanella sp. GutCb]PKG74233.1 hypothetical protein CXF86_14020 [Shewanella sp. GutCb]
MQNVFILALSLMLAACAAPTRTDKDEFFVVSSGNVPIEKVPHFVDCLTDGFNRAHSGLTNFEVRQSLRATGYRVETYTGSFNYLLMSADIFNDGNVVLNESSAAALINTNGEKDAFVGCLAEFKVNV